MADWYFRGKSSAGAGPNRLKVCPACRNLVNAGEEFCPFCAKRLRDSNGVTALLRRHFAQPGSMTQTLIGALVAVFLLQMLADMFLPPDFRRGGGGGIMSFLSSDGLTYIRMGSNYHALTFFAGEYWRLLSYAFLHFGLIHIGFNCWAFWDLGRLAERLWGARQLFAVFILTGITGGLFSLLVAMGIMGRAANSVGASGAICGVLGLLLGTYFRNKYSLGRELGASLIQWAIYILVFGLVAGADNGAHIGGLIGGGALGYFLPPTNITRKFERDRKVWNVLFWLSAGLLVVCVGCTVYYFALGPEYAVKDMMTLGGLLQTGGAR